MKHKFVIISAFLFCFSLNAVANAEQKGKLNWKPTTPEAVSKRANESSQSLSSPLSDMMQDPLINSTIGGYSNMLQNSTGGSYNAVEQQKMQADYVKQQANYQENAD